MHSHFRLFCGAVFFTYLRKYRLRHDPAAVHMDRLSRHVFGRVAGEKGDGFGDIFRHAGVADRDSLRRGFPFDVGVTCSDPRRGDSSRRDGIYADAAGRQFERERSRQTENAGFSRGIGRATGVAAEADI